MKDNLIDEIISDCRHVLIDDALDNSRIPIGYTCSYVPEVLLSIDNLFPVRLRAPGVLGTEIADTYLSSVICSYTRSLLEFAMDERYDFLGGIIFTASCDHLRRLYDNLKYLYKENFYYIIDVPNKISEHSLKWLIDELKMLIQELSSYFEIDIFDDNISGAISRQNELYFLLKSIGDLRKSKKPPISGTQFHKLILAAITSPQDEIYKHILKYRDNLQKGNIVKDYKARLMVVGGHLDDPAYINAIESTGAVVVADRFCTGSIPGLELISEDKEPLMAIAENIFNKTLCPRMMNDFNKRLNLIFNLIEEYRVDGIIIENIKFCDIWGVDSSQLVSTLRNKGVPVLSLEREYRFTGEGQLTTRVQAFLESMGKFK